MDSPETWRWIWMVTALVFAVGEIGAPVSLFFLPFAVGAAAAAVLAFFGVDVPWEFLAFVGVSGAGSAFFWPLGRRLDRHVPSTPGTGATRWIGRHATVLGEIPAGPHATGMVRIEREEWRAESADGTAIEAGTVVRVLRIDGTRAVVERVGPDE